MEYAEFEAEATAVWEEIPDAYRSGVDGLVLERDAREHPSMPDIYTLGECLTEAYPSDWSGPETTRSVLVLYYGSFRRLSELDPDFDWRYEIWETVTHELRHHLESLALEDTLEDVDYAVDENFKRLQGDDFDPYFFRSGEPVAPGVYETDRDVFLEVEFSGAAPPAPWLEFEWHGGIYAVEAPPRPADVTFLQIVDGIDTGAMELCLVLVRRRGWWAQLMDLLRRRAVTVLEAEVEAVPGPAPERPPERSSH